MKKIIVGISGAVSFVIFLILLAVIGNLGKSQASQTMAERWDSDGGVSQISCFFSVDAYINKDRIEEFEHSIDSALAEAAVVQESENPSARLWVDAYSADGSITISSDRSTLRADAIGIGGDFFQFHPLTLVSGSYFSGNDLMQDYCVIDRDAAWQLFGSTNVAGMTVYIGSVPHIITGVVDRPDGRLERAAGLDGTVVYVSLETLENLGMSNGINHYEIVMPNPVTGFAEDFVRSGLGSDEQNTEVVNNTTRYSFTERLKTIAEFGLRSMNGRSIIYPYWENVARGYEDILAMITCFDLLFLAYAVVVALVLFIIWWKHKGWTIRDKVLILKDKLERLGEKLYAKRQARKAGENLEEKQIKKEKQKDRKDKKEKKKDIEKKEEKGE